MNSFVRVLAAGVLATVGVIACGSDDTSGASSTSGGGSNRTGVTECGGVTCSAGQYCDNLICKNGCLSDDNCTGTQTCVKKSGDNVGSCQTTQTGGGTTTAPPTKNCTSFITWCEKCGGGDKASCTDQCDKLASATCTACMDTVTSCGETNSKCAGPCGGGGS